MLARFAALVVLLPALAMAQAARPAPSTRPAEALDALLADHADTAPNQSLAASLIADLPRLPASDPLWPRLREQVTRHADALVPTRQKPLKDPLLRVLLRAQLLDLRRLDPEQVEPHPAAAFFPGPVPADAAAHDTTLTFDTARHGWRSTGLYAPPGQVLTVTVPKDATGLRVRIGCHKDALWSLTSWKRVPEITLSRPLTAATTRLASPFGGPVYLEIPANAPAGKLAVAFAGAVEAPHFILDTTQPESWKTARAFPAPWAELEGHRIIISVPSAAIRTLDDPAPLMRLWDRIADAAADLAAMPHHRAKPERYVADLQIAAGYMHSGYPIMVHLDAVPAMTQVDRLKKGNWGLFHELGHNHQSGLWTFSGTTEVTCNLFTLYILETVCDAPPSSRPPLKERNAKLRKYFAQGAKFDDWCKDPFLALILYSQLREAFGWETYQKVFKEYRDLPANERPTSDLQKREMFMVRFSRAAGKNLGPFFDAWGIPTSPAAREAIATLPAWLPPDFPPAATQPVTQP